MLALFVELLGALSWLAIAILLVIVLSAARLMAWTMRMVIRGLARKPPPAPRSRVIFRGDRQD